MSKKKGRDNKRLQQRKVSYWLLAVLVSVILFTSAIRIRLLEVPLERDEGEYAYAGQLILQGVPPYEQVYNMKMPGIYAAYALVLACLGQTHYAIHLGLLIINAATILLMFLLAKKLFDPLTGLITAAAFALLTLVQPIQGIYANAEHFVLLPAIAGILLLVPDAKSPKWPKLLAGSALLGLAFIMKQHGAAFILFAGLYLIYCQFLHRPFSYKLTLGRLALFITGAILPFALTCLILYCAGVFDKFWFWTFDYARQYISYLSLSDGLSTLKAIMKLIVTAAPSLWILAVVGLTAPTCNKNIRKHCPFVLGFLLLSFLSTCPGFYFRGHYFLLLMPAVALLAGIGTASIYILFSKSRNALLKWVLPILLGLAVLGHTFYKQWDFFFKMTPEMATRKTYLGHPFTQTLEIARFIEDNSTENDRVAIIGSEPQLFFYANRRSATSYIYIYPLMEPHSYAAQMQQEMINQIESVSPKFLIYVNNPLSLHVTPYSDQTIFEWFNKYSKTNYKKVGIVDMIDFDNTVYRWDDEAAKYQPTSPLWILVLERKD